MQVYFRADAAPGIGSGHIARCLALAQALAARGAAIHFICQRIPHNLQTQITRQGFSLTLLPMDEQAGAAWLAGSQADDADSTLAALRKKPEPDWLIVDHYGLDIVWENRLREQVSFIGVIDDLADRQHDCDLLLDQNHGRNADDYNGLVPAACTRLAGTHYALLRPEFSQLRPAALNRRKQASLSSLLIAMGGFDPDNLTGLVLDQLPANLLSRCEIDVILGSGAPHLQAIARFCEQSAPNATLCVDVHDMAQRMMRADLAIGAGGTSSWERCCLGLPSLVLCLAENQRPIAEALGRAGAAHYLGDMHELKQNPGTITKAIRDMAESDNQRQAMSSIAAGLVDGDGAARVAQIIREHR